MISALVADTCDAFNKDSLISLEGFSTRYEDPRGLTCISHVGYCFDDVRFELRELEHLLISPHLMRSNISSMEPLERVTITNDELPFLQENAEFPKEEICEHFKN